MEHLDFYNTKSLQKSQDLHAMRQGKQGAQEETIAPLIWVCCAF